MKHSFPILLTMCILMIIGMSLIPGIDISNKPRPRQGKTLNISYQWQGTPAKVVEQNVTSRIEGLVSSVRGVESVSSVSNFGSGHITIQLKKNASVSGARFEIASLLRQVKEKLPKEVSYPELQGGEIVTGREKDKDTRILSYRVKADMPDIEIRKLAERTIKQRIEKLDGVNRVEVSGGAEKYMEISYNAEQMALYGLTSQDIEDAIRNYLGRQDIIGDIIKINKQAITERIPLFLAMDGEHQLLESIPVKTINGKIIYLNNLAKSEYKDRDPNTYYRINGMNTVYMNVFSEHDVSTSNVSAKVKKEIEKEHSMKSKLSYELTYDKAEEQFADFKTLIVRSGLSLAILLVFVFLCKRDLKYLFIIFSTLLANILIAVIGYRFFDIRLQPFSMAGITVSLGLIIDSTIVTVDHYSYHRNFKVYSSIVGAMSTTIGALLIIFWLPEYLKNDLYDFSWMIIINLGVALLTSALFAPALVERMGYSSKQRGSPRNIGFIIRWNKFYNRYIALTQHRIARPVLLSITVCIFGWSLFLFVDTINSNSYHPQPEEMRLHIMGQMPLGGTVKQLNEKIQAVETCLSQYKGIKRYVTNIEEWGAEITVEFKPELLNTSFPYKLENKVIGKLITIGGADWSTWGVSERGFSNSLNLQHRSNSIEIAGYEYDRLYRFAEEICKHLKQNNRVQDITIETPEHEHQEDEFYMEYDKEMLANDSISISDIHRTLSTMLSKHEMGRKSNAAQKNDYVLRSIENNKFDLWQLENSFIRITGKDIRLVDLMTINRREAKNSIPRKNQEYVLRIAFNVLGSHTYASKYIKDITNEFNAKLPIGFRCIDKTEGSFDDDGTQYWLIGLVVIIIFFICSILFEDLYKALVIILLIPTSLTGMFLTFHFCSIEFGTGGFAAMILLCGLTVNNGIYIINEYNTEHRYIKAYNHKIIPIFLTVFSTILGFIPFLIDGPTERFWFSFAVGSISGLLFSIISVIFTIPLFLKLCEVKKTE